MHEMATDQTQRRLASALGVRPDEVAVVDPMLEQPEVPASLPEQRLGRGGGHRRAVRAHGRDAELVAAGHLARGDRARRGGRQAARRRGRGRSCESRAGREGTYRSLVPAGGTRKYQPFRVEDVAEVRVKNVSKSELPLKAMAPLILFGIFATWLALAPLKRRRPGAAARLLGPAFSGRSR